MNPEPSSGRDLIDANRLYHLELIAERAAIVALIEAVPDAINETGIDRLEMSAFAPLRVAIRRFIEQAALETACS